jgi:hypothetical protein
MQFKRSGDLPMPRVWQTEIDRVASQATGLSREDVHAEAAKLISPVSCLAPLCRSGRYI